MVRYSVKKLIRRAGSSSHNIIQAFKAHISSAKLWSKADPLYRFSQMDFNGDSFMLNPFELTRYAFKWRKKEVAEYILLAGYRSWAHYTLTSDKTLELLHSPVSKESIQQNRLLRIYNNKIYFLYEEDIKWRNKLWD